MSRWTYCGKKVGFGIRCMRSIVSSMAGASGSRMGNRSVTYFLRSGGWITSGISLSLRLFLLVRSSKSAIFALSHACSSMFLSLASTRSLMVVVISPIDSFMVGTLSPSE